MIGDIVRLKKYTHYFHNGSSDQVKCQRGKVFVCLVLGEEPVGCSSNNAHEAYEHMLYELGFEPLSRPQPTDLDQGDDEQCPYGEPAVQQV